MTDIVERLRDSDQIDVFGLRLEAADEIERLRAELDTLNGSHRDLATRLADSGREIERLRRLAGR